MMYNKFVYQLFSKGNTEGRSIIHQTSFFLALYEKNYVESC